MALVVNTLTVIFESARDVLPIEQADCVDLSEQKNHRDYQDTRAQ